MGAGPSRQRPRPQQQAYPPPHVYQQQQGLPHYYPDPAYINNGNYGAWRPPYPPAGPFAPPPPQFRPPMPPMHPPPHPAVHQVAPMAPAQELTATIRNAVNLKKPTLSLQPIDGDPRRLAVHFEFDASEPCAVTTYVVATEDPSKEGGCKLTQSKQAVSQPVIYEKGLGQKYPKEGSPHMVLDVGLYDERQLMEIHDKDTYPLVIRLECITEQGKADKHTLQELRPGAPQAAWVQSQTTCAVLLRDEEGNWQPKVVKQKIWVEGVCYELQEIYGMESAPAAPAGADGSLEENEERLCVICLVNERDTTVLPCRHLCMCHDCAQELRKQTSKCPICRNHVDSLLHIKMSQRTPKPVDSTAKATAAVSSLKL
ncbi:probable E3 ubiquitin-protein ligase LUL1 [Coccomyxa sp. Obi]|nr:probable E3 ubiquitin-protein ligase LUL1 [Coccomyxa sp. Obi]